MSPSWLILADDLTGAADAAAAFARRGFHAEVTWGAASLSEAVSVHAVDLASRTSDAAEAARRHRDAVGRWSAPGRLVFKKIDSTLRGQPAAEMAAVAAGLRDAGRPSWGLLAPANPAMRRTVRDGHVFVDAAPLEASATWAREHTYPSANLSMVAASAGLRAVTLPLAELRGDESAVRAAFDSAATSGRTDATLLIADAETDADLTRLVDVASSVVPGFFAAYRRFRQRARGIRTSQSHGATSRRRREARWWRWYAGRVSASGGVPSGGARGCGRAEGAVGLVRRSCSRRAGHGGRRRAPAPR
ncbi:MAG: four-carbon acid sugar kinase family protein [Vicinamibacterales bacterium]